MRTKAVILILGLVGLVTGLRAQPKPQKDHPTGKQSGNPGGGGIVVPYQIDGKDTIPVCTIVLPGEVAQPVDSAMLAKQLEWRKYKRDVGKAMKYARILQDTLISMERRIASFDSKRDKKHFIRDEEDKLRETFTKQLKNLTRTQGKLLVKLIARQTGKTTYQLIKQYKNGLTAKVNQVFANTFGIPLDEEYVAAQEPDLEAALKEMGLK